jgi:hypothetical protein
MSMTAGSLAERSKTERVTASSVTDAGGVWSRAQMRYVFPDGSSGCFSKRIVPAASGVHRFDHYLFEETE